MAVQNPFFGKREPETFQPRHTTVTPSSSVNSVAPTSASTSAATATAAAAKAPAENSGSKLTVGPNIKLKGVEITDCDTLVVEGTVEATMDSRVIQIAEQGAFRGSADIDIAEIRGEFNGTLTVRDKLVIFGTGRVSGKIRYGKLVVEEGGQLSGEIAVGVPYKSSPQAMTDLVGGQVQVYVADLGSGMGMLKTDKVRALGVTTAQPTPMLAGVPPIGQTVKGFDLTSWNGIFGPAGLPPAVVARLNTELQAVLADKDLQDKLAQIGFQVWPTKTPEEFAQYVAGQLNHWRTLIQQAGIQPE